LADIIIHNGAQVNWMLPYSSLSAANVRSTADCVSLCDAFKAKRLVFVSSTSALDNEHYVQHAQTIVAAGGRGVAESDTLEGSRRGLSTGYGQSKWASEYIVREAGKRGLSGTIVRPGYVTGDPETGATITDDFLVRLWKGCLQVQSRPDICNTVNQVPVTQVARLVVASALFSPVQPLGVVQVTSHPRLTLNEWLGALELYGYQLPKVTYSTWVDALREYVGDMPQAAAAPSSNPREELALLPLFHMVTTNLPSDTIAPDLDDANAAAVLHHYGGQLNESAVTIDLIGRYLAYLIAIGFLPPPPTCKGARILPECPVSVRTTTTLGGRGGNPRMSD
jgi:L-aminoadipate-semialdehyde dehydrogenase